MGRFSL